METERMPPKATEVLLHSLEFRVISYVATVFWVVYQTEWLTDVKGSVIMGLPALILGMLHVSEEEKTTSDAKWLTGVAIISCGCADLLFYRSGSTFFILATAIYGFAHLFLIVSFVNQQKLWWQNFTSIVWVFLVCADYLFFFHRLLDETLRVSVLITYSIILGQALTISASIWYYEEERHLRVYSLLRFVGYAIFVVSDILVVLPDYLYHLSNRSQMVSGTYYISLLLIYLGNYLTDTVLHKRLKHDKMHY